MACHNWKHKSKCFSLYSDWGAVNSSTIVDSVAASQWLFSKAFWIQQMFQARPAHWCILFLGLWGWTLDFQTLICCRILTLWKSNICYLCSRWWKMDQKVPVFLAQGLLWKRLIFYAVIDYWWWQDNIHHIIWLRQCCVYLALAVEKTSKSLGSGLCGAPDDLFFLEILAFCRRSWFWG